ncbi:unnamed protein product, partial [Amoebophrya sp. A25]|eukprot:GSA25T00024091001.1
MLGVIQLQSDLALPAEWQSPCFAVDEEDIHGAGSDSSRQLLVDDEREDYKDIFKVKDKKDKDVLETVTTVGSSRQLTTATNDEAPFRRAVFDATTYCTSLSADKCGDTDVSSTLCEQVPMLDSSASSPSSSTTTSTSSSDSEVKDGESESSENKDAASTTTTTAAPISTSPFCVAK